MAVISTTEAEFLSLTGLIKVVISLRYICRELRLIKDEPTEILCDNRGAVLVTQNDASLQRTRHLGAHLAFAQESQEKGVVRVRHIEGDKQLADGLTKALDKVKFLSNRATIMSLILTCAIVSLVTAASFDEISLTVTVINRKVVDPIVLAETHHYAVNGKI